MPSPVMWNGSVWLDIAGVPVSMATTDTSQTITGTKTFSNVVTAPIYATTGNTGATTATRYAGGTASGAPLSGTYVAGDFVIAVNGHLWICTTSGTPGTWADAGAGAVTSVASRTGAVTLTAADIGAGTYPSGAHVFAGAVSGITTLGTTGDLTLNYTSPKTTYTDGTRTAYVGLASAAGGVSGSSATGDLVLTGPTRVYTPLSFAAVGSITSLSMVQGTVFIASGLSGATTSSRYVGATASGAPTSGTFATGDFSIAQNGHLWICTAGGSPGTWADAGTTAGGAVTSVASRTGAVVLTAADIGAGTFPGAITFSAATTATTITSSTAGSAARFIGGTATVAPTTGTWLTGDFAVSQNGHLFVCTSGGSPGTWVDAGSGGGAVTSVASRTGAVTLTAADIGAGTFPAAVTFAAAITATTVTSSTAGSAARFVGGTATVAPTTGTWLTGDFVISQNGHLFVCTAGGSPGTWADAGAGGAVTSVASRTGAVTLTAADIALGTFPAGGGTYVFSATGGVGLATTSPALEGAGMSFGRSGAASSYVGVEGTVFNTSWTDRTVGDFSIGTFAGRVGIGIFGATAAQLNITSTAVTTTVPLANLASGSTARFVGGTSNVAPTTGTWQVGDFVVTNTGHMFVCTTAGTPGTWTDSSSFAAALGATTSANNTFTGQQTFNGATTTFQTSDGSKTVALKARITANGGQSANLLEFTDVGGSTWTSFDATGNFTCLVQASAATLVAGNGLGSLGTLLMNKATAASGGTTTRDSSPAKWRSAYWTGSVSTDEDIIVTAARGSTTAGDVALTCSHPFAIKNTSITPTSAANQVALYSSGGRGKVKDDLGNVWNLDGAQVYRLTSAYTNATTTLSNTALISSSLGVGSYVVEVNGAYACSATTAGLKLALTLSGTVTNILYTLTNTTSIGAQTAQASGVATASGTSLPVTPVVVNAANQNYQFQMTCSFAISTASTVTLQGAASGTGTLTLPIGCYMIVRRQA